MKKIFNINRNMGFPDQVFRTCMGLVFIYFGPLSDTLTSDFISSLILAFIGILIIVSSFIGFCPLYHAAGINTYKKNSNKK